jgi:hypothetical protein
LKLRLEYVTYGDADCWKIASTVRGAPTLAENSSRYICPDVSAIPPCESCTSQREPLVDVTETFAEYEPTVFVEPSWRIVALAPVLTEKVQGVSHVLPVRSNDAFHTRFVAASAVVTSPATTRTIATPAAAQAAAGDTAERRRRRIEIRAAANPPSRARWRIPSSLAFLSG